MYYDFIRILEAKQPKFFLAENVSGMLISKHTEALEGIKELFRNAGVGYELSFQMLNASDYNVPQDRKRVFFIGFYPSFPKPLMNASEKERGILGQSLPSTTTEPTAAAAAGAELVVH